MRFGENEQRFIDLLERIGSVDVGHFVLTSTQVKKSIIDATENLRQSFSKTGFHDYETQIAGDIGRRSVPIVAVDGRGVHKTHLSLYRARGNHDPRLWIRKFKDLFPSARSGDIFIIAQDGRNALVLNASNLELSTHVEMMIVSVFSW